MSGASIAYSETTASRPIRGFPAYAWSILIYNLAVILWGALVRATGSGAGCGGSWPLCNGDVLPVNPQIATMIEFVHRAMSGVALVTAVILAVWGWKAYPSKYPARKHPARKWAVLSLVFMLTEALIGAALVLLGREERIRGTCVLAFHALDQHVSVAGVAGADRVVVPTLDRRVS